MAKPSNRKSGQPFRMFLSERDEYVPEDFLSITEIFTNPKCALPGYDPEQWCLGQQRLKEMRRATFNAVRTRFWETKAERFDCYWNGNIDAINELGLNEFAKLSCFKDLAPVMIAFEERIETKYEYGSKRKYISFGVRKKLYRKYYDSLKEALEKGEAPKAVYLPERKKRRTNSLYSSTQLTSIDLGTNENGTHFKVNINKNDTFLAFEQWCKLSGRSKKQGVYDAMQLIMEQKPVEGMGDISAYARKTDIDKQEVIVKERSAENVKVAFETPANILAQVEDIIRRYNTDPDNRGKQQLTKNMFITQAIAFYIKHLPLKYSDPIAYKEYMAIKEAQEYNDNLLETLKK
jgi:hypothetical protein